MHELSERLSRSALKVVKFFESKLEGNGSYGEEAQDISCYFKSPMMFISVGQEENANRILDYIKSQYMTQVGDFESQASSKSIKPEYIEYWSYINGWIVRAAQRLGRSDISEPAYKYLLNFNAGKDAGFLSNDIASENGVTDVLTTAHHGLINLERGNLELAISAGNYLCEAVHRQANIKEEFYLRFNPFGKPITDYESEQAAFYCVIKGKPEQLYFMIGYPSAYLALLYKETGENKYLEGAKAYLDFALTGDESVFKCTYSHKIAWAASILYGITREERYLRAVDRITTYFISLQDDKGMWYLDTDINASYDQSAEIAHWFMDIAKNLNQLKVADQHDEKRTVSQIQS